MSDYERIWLSPNCEGADREWCSSDVWGECDECEAKPTEYVRADKLDAVEQENKRLQNELHEWQTGTRSKPMLKAIAEGVRADERKKGRRQSDKLKAQNSRLKDALKTSSARIKRQRMEINNRLQEIKAAEDREKRLDAALAKALVKIVDLEGSSRAAIDDGEQR